MSSATVKKINAIEALIIHSFRIAIAIPPDLHFILPRRNAEGANSGTFEPVTTVRTDSMCAGQEFYHLSPVVCLFGHPIRQHRGPGRRPKLSFAGSTRSKRPRSSVGHYDAGRLRS